MQAERRVGRRVRGPEDAEDALVQIQGALVVARITGDPAPFTRTLKALPELLTDSNYH